MTAGAEKRWNHAQSQVSLLIHVVKHVANLEFCPKIAHTHASSYATQVLVLHVLTLAQVKAAIVVRIHYPVDAWKPTMILDGAAMRYAETSCLVESTPANSSATKASAALAK